jgi:hypothetical protein
MELAWDLKFVPPKGTALLVGDPTLLLAVSSAMWFSAFGGGPESPEGIRSELLSFRLPPEYRRY